MSCLGRASRWTFCCPYSRGDLVSKIHQQGEVLSMEHVDVGSRVRARVNPGLAGELAEFAAAHAVD